MTGYQCGVKMPEQLTLFWYKFYTDCSIGIKSMIINNIEIIDNDGNRFPTIEEKNHYYKNGGCVK
jgi:hypothetical protein